MIKALIFDFDGVILESADIKTEAFAEMFSDYPSKQKEIIDYHLINAGISRYVKFRYIYEKILGQEFTKEKEIELGRTFSQLVFQRILSAPFVPGAREFLDANKLRYHFFIASGTPEEELYDIIRRRGLEGYFKEIHGSPKKKLDIVNGIAKNHRFLKDEIIYIGDAESDRIAAEGAGIVFIERNNNANPPLNGPPWIIRDLFDLSEILDENTFYKFQYRRNAGHQ